MIRSGARERCFLMSDGRFLMEGSGRAIAWITYRLNGASLAIREQIRRRSAHEMAGFASHCYCRGALCDPTEPIVCDEAARTVAGREKRVRLPSLTPIS